MIGQKYIEELVLEALDREDLFLVEVIVGSNNKINVVLDSDKNVSIQDCIRISRSIEGELDRDTEDFSLEVASAGLGQPLKMLRQYSKYIGKGLEITVDSGVKLSGELTSVNNEFVELLEAKKKIKKNKLDNNEALVHKLLLNNIKLAKAIVKI